MIIKLKRFLCILLFVTLFLSVLPSCSFTTGGNSTGSSETGGSSENSESDTDSDASSDSGSDTGSDESSGGKNELMIDGMKIPSVAASGNVEKFESEVDLSSGEHNNAAQTEGIIKSPYYAITFGEKTIPCYSTRTSLGLHNFAYLDVTQGELPCEVTIKTKVQYQTADILPTYRNSSAEISGKEVKVTISEYHDTTIVFDEKKDYALTLFVRKNAETEIPEGYIVQEIEQGVHDEELEFKKSRTAMVFKPGIHFLRHKVELLDDTMVVIERGAYIVATMPTPDTETPQANPDWANKVRYKALFTASGKKNVKICGMGVIDYSRLDWHARGGIYFDDCDGVNLSGVTLINTPEWTFTAIRCENITVDGAILFAYRQNSDGFAIVDSAHASIKNCFARSGDDLFEVKSMHSSASCDINIEDIVFENCSGWPDKARGMGIIYESVRDMKNITFRNCSIGFASATWQDQLGAFVVILAGDANVSDVTFDDVEVYSAKGYPINVTLYDSSSAVITGLKFRNVRIRDGQAIRLRNDSSDGVINKITFSEIYREGKKVSSNAKLNVSYSNVSKTTAVLEK